MEAYGRPKKDVAKLKTHEFATPMWVLSTLVVLVLALLGFDIYHERERVSGMRTLDQKITELSGKVDLLTVAQFPDYSALKDMKKLTLVSDFLSWTPNSKVDMDKFKEVVAYPIGTLSRGYLYLRVSAEDKQISRLDDIYVTMVHFGGFLVRKDSLPTPPSRKTELLFPLESVSVNSPDAEFKTPTRADWLEVFDRGVIVQTYIKSLNPATIEEMSIYFDCIDPNECGLEIH